jgi:hypothetical protein
MASSSRRASRSCSRRKTQRGPANALDEVENRAAGLGPDRSSQEAAEQSDVVTEGIAGHGDRA